MHAIAAAATATRKVKRLDICCCCHRAPIVYVDQLKPQVGDVLIYNAPITRNFVIDTLSARYGPVMYCVDAPQIGGFAARMYSAAQHPHIAAELNGAVLNTGHCLSAGLLV
jgi:hypothetical protein